MASQGVFGGKAAAGSIPLSQSGYIRGYEAALCRSLGPYSYIGHLPTYFANLPITPLPTEDDLLFEGGLNRLHARDTLLWSIPRRLRHLCKPPMAQI